jgi:hypothetical protein
MAPENLVKAKSPLVVAKVPAYGMQTQLILADGRRLVVH